MARILVAYATKHGSTQEVAEAIAARIREHGLDVSLEPAADVVELDRYDGVVLGGSIYMARWHADAKSFLKRHRAILATRPLAVFAMGPLTTSDSDVAGAREQLDHALAKTPELEPVAVAIFGGVVDPEKLRFPFSRMPASDARDWETVRSWADEVTEKLGTVVAVPA